MLQNYARSCFYYKKYLYAHGQSEAADRSRGKTSVEIGTGIDRYNGLAHERLDLAYGSFDDIAGGDALRTTSRDQNVVGADPDLYSGAIHLGRIRNKEVKAQAKPD